MSDQQTLSDEAIASMNDIYVMLSEDNIAYLPYDLYANESRIIEKVNVDGTFAKRFFLNEEGVYPANLSGPAVTKVIPWNLEQAVINSGNNTKEAYQPGYFLDLRQLKMSRLNMIQISDVSPTEVDTPIPNDALPIAKNTFISVPKDQQNQLKAMPKAANLYIAFFQKPDNTRSSSECYSYCVSYISAEEVNQHLTTSKSAAIEHLQTYYGDTRVQAGALNPNDINNPTSNTTKDISFVNVVLGTCYVANLQTFKP
tara:strand:+ start:2487 stop:3254 length:768 start_codon:yes stop_codon:yes gene_type:complete